MIVLCRKYRARVSIRRVAPVRPEAEPLDGREVVVSGGWPFDTDEDRGGPYRGEWAMILAPEFDTGIAWIASGDLENLEEIEC
jgi:hypothetical protein